MKYRTLFLSLSALLIAGFLTMSMGGQDVVAKSTAEVLPDRVYGKADAPITMIEYASFTCSHCSRATNNVLPELDKKYIQTGKVKLIYRDYPMDGISLKASVISRCMPEDKYYPFVKIVHKNYKKWLNTSEPIETLKQYASMAGLAPKKVEQCLKDETMMDAIIAMRTEASNKYNISATPTFLFNEGEAKLDGNQPYKAFEATIEKLLAKQKQ